MTKTKTSKSKDQITNDHQIEIAAKHLADNNIKDYENIAPLFKNFGIKNKCLKELIKHFYIYIAQKKNEDKNIPSINCCNIRTFGKMNYSGKNVILNYICFLFPNIFINFLQKHFTDVYKCNIENYSFFFKQLKEMINKIKDNAANNSLEMDLLNMNTNEIECDEMTDCDPNEFIDELN